MEDTKKAVEVQKKPGMQLDKELVTELIKLGISEDEIKLLEVYKHLFYGELTLRKKEGKLDGRIHYRETY